MTTQQNEPEQKQDASYDLVKGSAFSSIAAFRNAQKMANCFCSSDIVPEMYRGKDKIGNCVIALEMAQRMNCNPIMIMQNIYVVHGKPAWSSQFLIACVNGCGRFSPLRYEMSGDENQDNRTCKAWAYDKENQERLYGPSVSIGMAKAEGWYQKNGSKWKTMPELMLRYRSATLFARLYAPELTMGMMTREEVEDIPTANVVETASIKLEDLRPGKIEDHKDVATANPYSTTEVIKVLKEYPNKEPENSLKSACEEYIKLHGMAIDRKQIRMVNAAISRLADNNGDFAGLTFGDIKVTDSEKCNMILVQIEKMKSTE